MIEHESRASKAFWFLVPMRPTTNRVELPEQSQDARPELKVPV